MITRASCPFVARALPIVVAVVATALAGCTRPLPDEEKQTLSSTCAIDADCAAGLCVDGVCDATAVPPDTTCSSKMECDGLVCRDGACVLPTAGPCASSDECPGDSVCDGFSRTCVNSDGSPVFPDDGPPVDDGPIDDGPIDDDGPPVDQPPVDDDPPVDQPPVDDEPPADDEPPPVDDDPPPAAGDVLDLTGYALENHEGATTPRTELPTAELVPGDVVVIARDADIVDFEAFWGPLPDGVWFMNAGVSTSGVPIVNGGERFVLVDPTGALVDGTTIAGTTGKSTRRVSSADAALATSWDQSAEIDATPGVVELPSSGVGLVISEWSDASGTGNFAYEFIELYWAP